MNAASLRQKLQDSNLRSNRWVRRAAYAVLALLVLWLVLWLGVPPLMKSQLQKIASEKLGRQVTVERIEFKPWTLELALHGLRVASAQAGAPPQLEVGRIYVDAELQSALRFAPVIDAVTVDAPMVRVAHRGNGSYDFDDILARFAGGPPPEPDQGPPRFAVYNISIHGGGVEFDDQGVGRKHELRELELAVPFLSSLKSKREVKVEPKLAFVLNGSRFDSTAFSTPFADDRKTDAHLQFSGLDLAPYLGYVPKSLPVQLQAGKLDADLKIDFAQAAATGLKITGSVEAHDTRVTDGQGGELLGFGSLRIGLADVRPLERVVHLNEIALTAPSLTVARDGNGQINLLSLNPATGQVEKAMPIAPAPAAPASAPAAPASAPAAPASAPVAPASAPVPVPTASAPAPAPQGASSTPAAVASAPVRPASAPAGGAAAPGGWKLQVDRIALKDGRIGWRDAAIQPAASLDATELGVDVEGVLWPMASPARFSGGTRLGDARLRFKGEGTDKQAKVETEVDSLPLSLAAPYLAQSLEPTLDGKLSGQIDVDWAAPTLKLNARRVLAENLALTQGKTALASVGGFEIGDAQVDLSNHVLAIGSFAARQPKISIERDSEKRWMFERWLKTPAAGANAAEPAARTAAARPADAPAPARPWQLSINELSMDGGTVSYSDKASATPVAVEFSALQLKAQKLAPESATPSPVQLSGRIASGRRADPGRFDFKGTVGTKPLVVDGRVETAAMPLHAFKAYYSDALNVDIRRVYTNFKGAVRFAQLPAGPSLKVAGDSAIEDLRANSVDLTQSGGSRTRGDELLSWKALSLRGLQVDMQPNTPLKVDVRETTLTDFFARVIVEETGRLNLQSLTKAQVASQQADDAKQAAAPGNAPAKDEPTTRRRVGGSTVTTNRPAARAAGQPQSAEAQFDAGPGPTAPAGAAASTAAAEPDPMAPVINFGPVSLVNGKVDFSDLFVKPNYSADLSELTGRLSAFSSRPVDGKPLLADLELRGKAQQTAQLEITGKLNPLAKPLELDITARMRDLDLAPLSTYSVRYAGHGIERGKLSMDVNYKVAPDGTLTATNKLVLNQLQFGDEVKGAPNSLPVRLAVALLADRNGVIDVDLPLRGSINDPQFSVGPLIWKAVVNLIVKAVTAPFSLLTGGLGGGAGEASVVVFDNGSATLPANAKESLDKVVKALNDRPGLRMTVVGTASLDKEREGYRRQRLREMALAEKRRLAVRAGGDGVDVPAVTDAEYPELLATVYRRADITKPRNMVGLARTLPAKEMEDLLLASIPVDEQAIRELALARGAAVRDYLLAEKLPSERIFLGAVRLDSGAGDWKPGAELKLDTR